MYVVEMKDVSVVEVLVWPVFSFAAAAFGFDQYAKLQGASGFANGRGTKRSSQYPNRENQLPDSRDYQEYGDQDK